MKKSINLQNSKKSSSRVLGRKVAQELTMEQLEKVIGGTTSCCNGRSDDCDERLQIS